MKQTAVIETARPLPGKSQRLFQKPAVNSGPVLWTDDFLTSVATN